MSVLANKISKVTKFDVTTFNKLLADDALNGFSKEYSKLIYSKLAKAYSEVILNNIYSYNKSISQIKEEFDFNDVYEKFKCKGIDLYDFINVDMTDKERGEHFIFGDTCPPDVVVITVIGFDNKALSTNTNKLLAP